MHKCSKCNIAENGPKTDTPRPCAVRILPVIADRYTCTVTREVMIQYVHTD
jgi:hypothetical protein